MGDKRVKYVCTYCGKMLPVDRDIDEDRTFEYVVAKHDQTECPHEFLNMGEMPWMQRATGEASA